MKICFEGPSGVGKTTLSKMMKPNCLVIPEVNQLFKGEVNEGGWWYYDKQIQRFQLSTQAVCSIFDGDIFQPLWYNWSYSYPEGYFGSDKVCDYYLSAIRAGRILFPDLYFLLNTSEANLRKRKEGDATRRRKNFEKHLKLRRTQPRYFGAIHEAFPAMVELLEFGDLKTTHDLVLEKIELRKQKPRYDSEEVLEFIRLWLSQNKAENGSEK